MEIKSTEKEENMENNNIEIENEQLGKNDSNSIDSISKNKNIFSSNLRGSEETHFSSDNKSISAEKPDKREDPIQYIHSTIINNNTKNNSKNSKLKGLKKSSPIKEKKIPHQFHIFLERTEDFQKKKTENINQLHQNYEESIKKIMQNTPQLTKKSRLIDKRNSKPKFLDRIKDEQIKQKQRKEKLIEKVNLEKVKKKEEIDKPLKFNIKKKEDKKFMKAYKIMLKRQNEVNERFKIFNNSVKEYTMRECTFSPKINKFEDDNDNKDKDDLNERMVKRMYNHEIKYRNKRKDELYKKYMPSFHPKINSNAERLSRNWKNKLSSRNQTVDYEINDEIDKLNNAIKRMNKSTYRDRIIDEENNYEDE